MKRRGWVRQPNILLFMPDRLRGDWAGPHNAGGVRTPGLARVAARGVRILRAICPAPIRVPSRTSEMTAHPPEVTGVCGNEGSSTRYPCDRDLITFPEHFARNGHRTLNVCNDRAAFQQNAAGQVPQRRSLANAWIAIASSSSSAQKACAARPT